MEARENACLVAGGKSVTRNGWSRARRQQQRFVRQCLFVKLRGQGTGRAGAGRRTAGAARTPPQRRRRARGCDADAPRTRAHAAAAPSSAGGPRAAAGAGPCRAASAGLTSGCSRSRARARCTARAAPPPRWRRRCRGCRQSLRRGAPSLGGARGETGVGEASCVREAQQLKVAGVFRTATAGVRRARGSSRLTTG
jgi:hypothetical protein